MSRLTGNKRYRAGWFGRLVLQVEVDVAGSPWVSQMSDGTYTKWRDARCEDIVVLDDLLRKAPSMRRQLPVVPPKSPPEIKCCKCNHSRGCNDEPV